MQGLAIALREPLHRTYNWTNALLTRSGVASQQSLHEFRVTTSQLASTLEVVDALVLRSSEMTRVVYVYIIVFDDVGASLTKEMV